MTAKQLKNSILKEAFNGKLVSSSKNWKIKTIGEICEINPKNKLDDNLEVSFIPMNLILDKFQNKFSYEIKNWKDIKKGYTHLQNNCIALAKITPCFENGKCVILRNLKNGYGAGTTELIILLPNSEEVLIEYVFYFINTQYFIEQGKRNFRGTAGQLRISTNFVSNFSIPLPPLEEQNRIVNKLNELMPLIEEYEKLEVELNELDKKFPEQLKKSILKEAFDGKLIKSTNKWKELTFSKCVNIVGIKHKIKRKDYLKNGKYPVIDQSYNFISGYSSNQNILINIKKPVIIFGDHTRCFKFVDFDFIAGADGIKILEPKEFFNEKLFYYFCLSLNIPNRGYSRHYKFLTKIKMRIPPIEEQKRIVEKLDELMELCEGLKRF